MKKKHIRNRLFKVISDFSEAQRENPLQGLEQWDYEPADMRKYGLNEQGESPPQGLEQWEYEPDSHDKREHPRKDVPVYGIFETEFLKFRASAKNISAGGVLIDPKINLSLNQLINIETDLPLNEYMFMTFFHRNFYMPIRANGKVVRVGSDGVGIQFNEAVPIMSSL